MMPQLERLARDAWWEVQAQLIVVCSKLLDELDPRGDEHAAARVVGVVFAVFTERASVNIRKVGLAYLGRRLGRFPDLAQRYVAVLLGLASDASVPLCAFCACDLNDAHGHDVRRSAKAIL